MSEAGELAGAPPHPLKQDPESLVLRGRPRPVIRFRKGLIIGLSGAVSISLVALTWVSLKPPSFRFVAGEDAGEPVTRSSPDAVAGAPAAYSDVPRLGPPLPGDLGRPIVDQQRERGNGITPAFDGSDPAAGRIAAERQKRAADEQSARASSVLFRLSETASAAPPAARGETVPVAPAAESAPIAAQAPQLEKQSFATSVSSEINPHALTGPVSPWTLTAGTVIPASLITGLNSDLPGTVVAQVTDNVRDSVTGRTILVPQGSRLIGVYDSAVAFGQKRALLIWQRILFPDGSSISLDNMPATDASGYAGLEDKVDFHEWRLLKGVALATLLGVGAELGAGSDRRDLVQALRESAQQNGSRAGDQIVSRNLDVQPTLTVRPGWPVRVLVHRDLVLKPWRS